MIDVVMLRCKYEGALGAVCAVTLYICVCVCVYIYTHTLVGAVHTCGLVVMLVTCE